MVNKDASGSGLHRRDEILRIVVEERVRSQEEIQQRLRRRGIRVTQPTLSRDLKDLAIAKTSAGYVATGPGGVSAPPADGTSSGPSPAETLDRVLREFVLSVELSGTLVVVKTPPAAANPVARALDDARLPGSAGTIAGDDTIFLAARSVPEAVRLASRLLRPIHPGAPASVRVAAKRPRSGAQPGVPDAPRGTRRRRSPSPRTSS